jgi:hypothetical protein
MQAASVSRWIGVAGLLVALCSPLAAAAAEQCDSADSRGIQRCSAGLESTQVQQMQRTQEKSNWCWAASVAMVFAHHGLVVSQEQVVRRHLGEAWDVAVAGSDITRVLRFGWRDAGGRGYVPLATVRDAWTGQLQLSDTAVARELAQERPLILAAQGHAMVLVRVEFERAAGSQRLRITGGTVIDPLPGRGVRSLRRGELDPSYLAAVQLAPSQNVAAAGDMLAAQP